MSAGRRAHKKDGRMTANNEQLAFRFVELLADKAMRNGQAVPRWTTLPSAWRRIYTETVAASLEGLGHRVIADGRIDERQEDEQIRLFCENLTARQRLKTYPQLYAWGVPYRPYRVHY
jgi:hypothetical protein